jgi:hypothetical protein
VIGFVSPALSSAVGDQIAWGDFVAAVLALFSIAALTWRWAFAIPIVWILNLWGTADLLNAYYKGVTQVAHVGLFGAAIHSRSRTCRTTAPCQCSLRRLRSFWLRQFKANRIASWLRRARGSGICLLRPRLKTWNGVVCPRSLLRTAGLWSTNGR